MVVQILDGEKQKDDEAIIKPTQVTVNAFNSLKEKEKYDPNLKNHEEEKKSSVFKTKVKVWTNQDDQIHTYFHSLSVDVQVEDFMGTAELRCPYDSDLMEYWEPIRASCVIYGANKGDYKILFIGRVREVIQDGYELSVTLQNYGWKFKQTISQSYANDNVLNKDAYTIMQLMFEALKIDSYVISESAKNRLKQVGINQDGNLTNNGEEVEEIPDLIERLKASDPSQLVSKQTLDDKIKESEVYNIDQINFTLRYEEPSPIMQEIASQGSFSAGNTLYSNPYGSAGGGGGGGDGGNNGFDAGGAGDGTPSSYCPDIPGDVYDAIDEIFRWNRNQANNYDFAWSSIMSFAQNHPQTYTSYVEPCLGTLCNYSVRDGNAACHIMGVAGGVATASGTVKGVSEWVNDTANWVADSVSNAVNTVSEWAGNAWNTVSNAIGGLFGW